MNRARSIIISTVIFLLLLTGCGNIFEFNLFDGIDNPELPSAGQLREMGDGALDYLSQALQSGDFMELLTADPEAAAEILNFLQEDYLSELPTDETRGNYQEAAILYAAIEMGTTAAAEVSGNILNLFSSDSEELDPSAVFPDNMTEEEFDAALEAMLSAADVYTLFGNSLSDIDQDGDLDSSADANLGEVVQNAAVAIYVQTVVQSIPGTEEEQKALFKEYIIGGGADPVPEDADIADQMNANTSLDGIFEAAGFSLDF